jgi:hypothetical protein
MEYGMLKKIIMWATQGMAGVFGQGKPAPTLVTFTFLSKASLRYSHTWC